ncbi:hypothetical protein [Mangrovimonas futianensis]|uniref:hypothetical protein n=1 Tax=Mangrovimonas futianensis TaxID=2895523 RepID=UPI001E3006D4|nr:hypothetical protein [Mangrovimonas futianensis]MCF1422654.1 hypothetical protein [Mangrovimonas futianensis]
MNPIISATLQTLSKSRILIENLDDQILINASIGPYYSSIGSHLRHIFDFYHCIIDGVKSNHVDLTYRKRDKEVETSCLIALEYLENIQRGLGNYPNILLDEVTVVDDLGLGKTEISYTHASLLAQANSHAIHHYAIINYILHGLNVSISDLRFGYNPTTPSL